MTSILILLIAMAARTPLQSAADSNTATVTGHVYYKDGKPVEGAVVGIFTDGPVGGILPDPVHSDKEGAYTIRYPALGMGVITASKPQEGFPNLELALYGRGNYKSLQRINLLPGAKLTDVDLHFGDPYTVLTVTVHDVLNKRAIGTAYILVEWTDSVEDPADSVNAMISATVPADGVFTLPLPRHALAIKVSAPGYADWRYRDTRGDPLYVRNRGKERAEIDVRLQPKPQ